MSAISQVFAFSFLFYYNFFITKKFLTDFKITTDREHPSISAHAITLTTTNAEPLTFTVPWPFLVDGIESLVKKMKKNKIIHLILKKSLSDPWPEEFVGRSKWDVDLLKRWKNVNSNGNVLMHMEAQFNCRKLALEKQFYKNPSPSLLDEVREIVRAIFYGHHCNSFTLFAIYDHHEELMFHLRIQPPVRFTPQGSPLLVVSVIDHQIAKKLISQGKLDPETNQFEFHRLITERVSKEVCVIRASSTDEVNLFRYVFRLNSTRMRRGAWQSKNLPRGENSPWMPTFLSPLYVEDISSGCNKLDPLLVMLSGGFVCHSTNRLYSPSCAYCSVKKVDLKKCRRCKEMAYCSVACQKKHWIIRHKTSCFPSYYN